MAIINQGITGALSGKVGNLIGASWKGIPYVRIKPASVSNPRTPSQQGQRAVFKLMLFSLRTISAFLKFSFREYAVKMSAFNAALSYNLKYAVTGDTENSQIDYTNVLVSRGSLEPALNAEATAIPGNKISVSWENNAGVNNASESDAAMIVVMNPEKVQSVSLTTDQLRLMESAEVSIPAAWSGDTVYCYLAFSNQVTKISSDSVLAGQCLAL